MNRYQRGQILSHLFEQANKTLSFDTTTTTTSTQGDKTPFFLQLFFGKPSYTRLKSYLHLFKHTNKIFFWLFPKKHSNTERKKKQTKQEKRNFCYTTPKSTLLPLPCIIIAVCLVIVKHTLTHTHTDCTCWCSHQLRERDLNACT